MAHIILMPQKGVSEDSAVLAEWYIKPGDKVKPGNKLFSVENGKAAYDEESEIEGTVLALLCEEGEELPVKAPVCVIGAEGEKYEVPKAAASAEEPAAADAGKAVAEVTAAAPITAIALDNNKIAASPRAKNLAKKAGADIVAIGGTGPDGRIIERDVNAYLNSGRPSSAVQEQQAAAPAAVCKAVGEQEYTEKPISRMRKIIGENMQKSLSGMAQLTLNTSFDATQMLEFRKMAKSSTTMGLDGVTINDLVLYAVARTLPEFRDLNANFDGEKMKYFNHVQLGFACDTERGLMVPVVRNADELSLLQISKAVKKLASAAQDGSVASADLVGGSFTVSNLGAFGIESFTPVINPPQTGILGVNTIETKVKEENGALKAYKAMSLSLTFDHRAIDGAPAAKFLKALCANLENFQLLLAK